MNRNVIIVIIIVVIIAIVGAFALSHQQGSVEKIDKKIGTKINCLNDDNATFKNGDQLQFELKDANGTPIAGEHLNITFSKGNDTNTVVTDSNGKYTLTLENVTAGDNVVIVKYAGNDKYYDYELQKTITVE